MGIVSPNDVEFLEDVAGDDWYGDSAVYAFNSGTLIKLPKSGKLEVKSRGVHATARGGNLICLKELLGNCDDVLEYRDVNGPAILHGTIGVNKGVNRTMLREENLLKN